MPRSKLSARKRPAPNEESTSRNAAERLALQLEHMQLQMRRLLSPAAPQGGFQLRGFDFHDAGALAREAALSYMWERKYADVFSEILDSNPDLADLLDGRTSNTYSSRLHGGEEIEERRNRRLNYLGGLLLRNRNQHFLPKHQLLLAVQARHKQLNVSLWAQLCHMRLLPSYKWTNDFIAAALELEHKYVPGYPVVDWLSAAVFDNYTEQVNYSAAHNADSQGERLDMTNWATLYLPKKVLPAVNLAAIGDGSSAPTLCSDAPFFLHS